MKFYIIRTEHSNPEADWLYAMTDTLAEAMQLCHDEQLQDTVIQICKGSFPFDYEVVKQFRFTPHTCKGV